MLGECQALSVAMDNRRGAFGSVGRMPGAMRCRWKIVGGPLGTLGFDGRRTDRARNTRRRCTRSLGVGRRAYASSPQRRAGSPSCCACACGLCRTWALFHCTVENLASPIHRIHPFSRVPTSYSNIPCRRFAPTDGLNMSKDFYRFQRISL